MQIFKLLLFSFFLILSFTFSGCQGNNSDAPVDNTNPDENTTLPPIDINATTDTKKLAIVNGNVITVTGSGSTKDIFIMAFNSSNSTNTEGSITFQYPVEFINNNVFYGSMDPGTATIVDGRVHFVYTAPNDITDINGTRVEFRFYDTKNADANVSLYIDFNLTGDYVSTDPVLKTLTLSDANLTINSSSQVENLILQAYTDQSTTDIDVELNIKYPQDILDNNINIGILPATLDVQKGIVTFNYQGVPDIEATIAALNAKGIANPIKVNIYDAKTGANVDLNLNFETPPAVDPKYNNYELNIFPENNISIIANEQEVVLEVFLENNSTGLPVASESVFIEFFDSSEGTINSFSGLTDVNGHIVFNYKAPADITASDDFNMTFKLRGDINNVKYRPVSFNLNGTTKDYTGYSLSTIPKNANITRPLQEKIIDVYVENNSSRPAEGETLLVKYFSGSNGTMDKFSAVTDENGHASFIYTAPETLLADGSDYNVTISINGTDLPSDISFTVLQDTTGVLHEISLLPDTIKVLKSDQNNIIKILTLDANRIGVSTEIVIEQPSKDGIDYGSFNTLKLTTNEDGYADVNFTSPANIDNLDNRTILFRDINTLQEHNLTISYEKSLNLNSDLYEIGLTQDDDIAVESSGQAYLSIFKSKTPTELIKSWYVYDVNVTTRYGDKIYFDANDKNADSITFQQTAEQGFSIYTKQQASVVVLDVTANIFDGENNVTITNSFPVVINSGELSSISMFFASTENDPVLNTYTDYYTVHAVDKFGNPVNTGTVIHPTLVNGIKHSSLTDVNGTGELVSGANATFADATQNFSDVEASSDRLIVLASQNQTNKYFFGNWEIESVGVDLNLTDELDDNSSISLKYVIGNEKRVFTNNGTDSIAVANVQAIDGVYETDANGNLRFKVVYDPALRGEKVYIAANAETSSGKIGIAIEAVLAYTGKRLVLSNNAFSITNAGESVSIDTTLYDEAHNVISATPSIAVVDFNTSIGSYEISGLNHNLLVYTAPEKLADLKTLKGTTHTFRIALEATENIYETVTVTFPADNNYTGYSLKVIPNDFIVKKENDSKEFKVYILDANGDIIVNEQLVADFFDTKKGSMADYYAISTSYFTNYATFTYIAPDNISGLENTAFDFNITMQNDKNITAPVKVNFIQRVDDINYTNYDITTLDSNITIRSGLESHVIDIYLQGDENRPAENETILLDFFNGSVGSISSFSAITDSTGHATFNYTSPSDLSTIDNNSTILTFKMDNNQQKDVNITLLVDTTVVSDPKYDNYVLSVYPESNVSITANSQESVLEVYLEDNTTNLPVANEGVVIEFFDVSKGSMNAFSGTTDVNGHIAFNYKAPADISTANDFNITFKLSADVNNTDYATIDFTAPPAVDPKYDNYVLTAYPESNVTITSGAQQSVLEVYLEDNTTNLPVSGESVIVEFFDNTKGTLNTFSAATDTNGHIAFNYTAPADISGATAFNVVFKLSGSTDVNDTLEIDFNTTVVSDPKYDNYVLSVYPESNVSITANSQESVLEVYLEDNVTNLPVANEGVVIEFFDVSKGSMNAFSGTTDVNGQVLFNYIAPADITGLADLNITFKLLENVQTTNFTTILFDSNAPQKDYSDFTLTLVDVNRTITAVSQTEIFNLYLEDNTTGTLQAAVGDIVTVDYFNGTLGTLASFSGVTDDVGHVQFTYTAPENLTDLNGTVITFRVKNTTAAQNKAEALISVDTNSPQQIIAKLAINEVNTTISQDLQLHTIIINALDANNNFVTDGTINVTFPNVIADGTDVGTFTSFSVAVVNGRATFNYTGPTSVQDTNAIVGNGALTFEFNDALGNGTPVSWNVTFNPDVPVIRLAVNTITLTQNDETVSVQVLAFDENNQSLDSGTISVAYPTEIINSGVNGGRFLENEATITSGEALFTFQGPLVLENINALVFTFSYKGNSLVTSKDLTVNYSPPTAAIYLNETTKEVTLNSETINIEVDVRDANNNPFPTGSVKIVYPNDVQTGRDIGSFLTSEIALLDGKASFVYTAPKNLDSNTSDIVFGFYHDSLPTNIKNFTVTLNPEPNQVILTDYFLTNSYADGSISMDLESTKLITFYIKDKDGTLLEDSNITSIDVTLLNTSLADLADTNASSTPSDSKTLTKNSSSLSVLSNTTSGVVPIKVFAQFKGVNNEDVNLTEIFNVVIVSGPPTSMSISYVSTTNDDVNARFIEKMIVAITDKYSNRVDSKPGISVALIAGYASDTSGPLDYMYHTYGATIDASDDKIKVESGKVMKATITSSGSDYDIAPTVTLGGGDGDFAATAYLSTFGGVSSVNMIRGGAEYISEPVVTAKGSGSGFAATAVLANTGSFFTDTVSISTGLEILNLDNAGSGYTSVPTVSAAGGNGDFDALAVLSSTGSIKSLSIDTAGSGYSAGDVLPVDGDGTGGSVKVKTVDGGGAITELVILDGGSGYTSVSVDTLTTGNQDASVSATLGFSLKEVQLRDGGTGYSDETLTVAGGSPTVNAQVSGRIGYSVASVTVTAIGSGFRSATIGFDGGKTDGSTSEEAVASATIKYPVSFIEITNGGTGYADGALTITAVGTGSGAAANAEVFADFSTVTENSGTNDDYLMTFGDGYAYNASGKWDITSSGANDEFERVLTDQFDGNTTTRLGFAIGNNQRQDVCLSGKEWVATANTPALEFNENGLAEIEITYDYYLAAKDVVVSANLVGVQNSIGEAVKLGEATKHTLRGTGLIADTLELPSGLDHAIYRIQVELDGAPNTFRNSNFNYTVSSASLGLTIHNVHDSMDDGIHECPSFNDEGRAYVELEVSTTLPSTVTLDNLVISREFK